MMRFGAFELDPERRQLFRDGQPVPLETKPYELLLLLAVRRPRAVSRNQIRDAIWPNVTISDSTLAGVVASLRQALGDDARQPQFIRTVHGFGYAFSADVRGDGASADATGSLFGARAADGRNPYPGLRSFHEGEAEYFFGREVESAEVWGRIKDAPFTALFGPSGAGKTSLLRAGLTPRRPAGWAALAFTPGQSPILALARALGPELASDAAALAALPESRNADVTTTLVQRWRRRHDEALLVVDQFEELFTRCPVDERGAFVGLLARVTREADVRVLLSLRDDFLVRCHEYRELEPVFRNLIPLLPPAGGALRRALEEPARRAGCPFEDEGMVEDMILETRGARAPLPLLAFAASRLWEERDRVRKALTRVAYESLGGVAGALVDHAERTLLRIGSERQEIVRDIFRRLVTAEGTRVGASRSELLAVCGNVEHAAEVLDRLIEARLLTSFEAEIGPMDQQDGLAARGGERIELIHESLLRVWPKLVRWQAQDADGAELRDQLRQAAAAWHARGRHEDVLWTGTAVREYQLWRERFRGGLSAEEQAFAAAMVARSERRARRLRAAIASGIVALLVVAFVLFRAQQEAVAQARRAEASKLFSLGLLEIEGDPTLALAFATKSLELSDTPEVRRFALRALQRAPIALLTENSDETDFSLSLDMSPDGRWLAAGGYSKVRLQPRAGGPSRVFVAHEPGRQLPILLGFGPSGDVLATLRQGDDELRMWSVGEILRRPYPSLERTTAVEAPVIGVEPALAQVFRTGGAWDMRANGARAFSFTPAGDEEVIRTWPFGDGEPQLIGSRRQVGAKAIDPTGRWLLIGHGRQVWLRSLDDWAAPGRLVARHEAGDVTRLAYHSDGVRFASQASTDEIRLWSLAAGDVLPERVIDSGGAYLLGFAPAGERLVAARSEGRVAELRLWGLDGPPDADPLVMRRGALGTQDVAFDPSGEWLVSAGAIDGDAYWPIASDYPRVLRGHRGWVSDVEFTPDGKRLVSLAWDGVRVWPLSSDTPERGRVVFSEQTWPRLALDSSGDRVAVVTRSGRLVIVPLGGGEPLELARFPSGTQVLALAFDGEGHRLAVGAYNARAAEKVIRIWDIESGAVKLLGPVGGGRDGPGGYVSLAFTPEGSLLSGSGGTVAGVAQNAASGLRRWNVEQGTAEILDPRRINNLSLSRDGRWAVYGRVPEGHTVAPGNWGVELVRTDLSTGEGRVLEGYGPDQRTPLALDSSGAVISTGDEDGVVYVGRSDESQPPHLLFGHEGGLWSVAISADGRWIASGDEDGAIRLWPVPDLDRPHLLAVDHDTLLERLHAMTNLRVVEDSNASTGYRGEIGPFPGWESVPRW